MSISRFPPRRQQRIFAFPPPCGRATAAFPGHETAPSTSRASTGNRGCGCRDCVLPSSAPGSGRPRSPAGKLVRRKKASFSVQRRRDLKEGVSPSFIVSIRGVKRIAALRCLWQIQQSRNFRSRAISGPSLYGEARKWQTRQGVGKKSKSSPSCVVLFSSPFLLDKQEKRGSLPPSFARATHSLSLFLLDRQEKSGFESAAQASAFSPYSSASAAKALIERAIISVGTQ